MPDIPGQSAAEWGALIEPDDDPHDPLDDADDAYDAWRDERDGI